MIINLTEKEIKTIDYCLQSKLIDVKGLAAIGASYGNYDDPENISLECEDCGEVILDAELYTICAREDI